MSGYQYLPTSGHVVLRREVPLVEFAAQHLAPECWPAEVPSDVDLAAVCDHEVALAIDSGPFPLAYVAINTEDPNGYFYVYRIDDPSGVFTYGNTKGRPCPRRHRGRRVAAGGRGGGAAGERRQATGRPLRRAPPRGAVSATIDEPLAKGRASTSNDRKTDHDHP